MGMTVDEAIAKAREIGAEHGASAASWVFDGNTTEGRYRAVLNGLEEGDPEVLDTLPSPDLSGQWADGYSSKDLFDELGVNDGDLSFHLNLANELCDAYEEGYASAVEAEVTRVARVQLETDD